MGASTDRTGTVDVGLDQRGMARQRVLARFGRADALEALAVVLSPLVVALVLRLRLMAPSVIPDPALHTISIISG